MKNTFKTISKLLALGLVVLTHSIPISAINAENPVSLSGPSLYIETESVPISASNYARDIFSNLDSNDMEFLGFTYADALDMRLAPGFTADKYENDANADVYYFPVLCNNTFVAMFIVTSFNGTYGYQFGKDDLADALNRLSTSKNNPVEIIVSDDAFFSVDNRNNVTVLCVAPESSEDNIDVQLAELIEKEDNISVDISVISNVTVFGETLKTSKTSVFAYTGKNRTAVPYVKNIDNTCWASCTGAIIEYLTNEDDSTVTSAEKYRDDIRADRYDKTESYSGGSTQAKSYIKEYTTINTSITGGKLTWEQVTTQILTKDFPCYMRWDASDTGHAMVLCGYRYENTKPDDTDYYGMYIMDPNKSARQLVGYNSTYTVNGTAKSWTNTLVRS